MAFHPIDTGSIAPGRRWWAVGSSQGLGDAGTPTHCHPVHLEHLFRIDLYCGCTGDRASIVATSSLGVVASWCHSVHEPSYIATLSYPCKYKAIATPAAETPPPHVATRQAAWSAPISWR